MTDGLKGAIVYKITDEAWTISKGDAPQPVSVEHGVQTQERYG